LPGVEPVGRRLLLPPQTSGFGAEGHNPHHPVEEGAEPARAVGFDAVEGAVPPEALDEDFLDGVVKGLEAVGRLPSRSQVGTDDRFLAPGEVVTVVMVALGSAPDDGPAGCVGASHGRRRRETPGADGPTSGGTSSSLEAC